MEKVLSQDEVDSLLGGISEGKVETEAPKSPSIEGLKAYDFSAQIVPVHLKLPSIKLINEKLASLLRTNLSNVTRSIVDVAISETQSVRFGEYLRSIPVPTSLNIFRMAPLKGSGLLIIEGSLVFAFVDTFFGGKGGRHVKLEGRPFTNIETKIIEKIVKVVLGDFENAWSGHYDVKIAYSRSEIDPQFARVALPSDVFIITKLRVDLESAFGEMTLCVPYSMIEPIRKKLRPTYRDEKVEVDKRWRAHIEERIRNMAVSVKCTLGGVGISGKKLVELKVNDVIELDRKLGEAVIVSVENIPKFRGSPGSYNKKHAVRIDGYFKRSE